MNFGVKDTVLIKGVGVGDGISKGTLKFLKNEKISVTHTHEWDAGNENKRFSEALVFAGHELEILYSYALSTVGESEAEIFEIHKMMLEDDDWLDDIKKEILSGRYAEDAVISTCEKYKRVFAEMDDEYFSARSRDIGDIADRLLRALSGENNSAHGTNGKGDGEDPNKYIIVANDLSPEETVRMDRSKILGFVTFEGTVNSHTAILARSMGIPALVSTGKIDPSANGATAIIDAQNNTLVINPDKDSISRYLRRIDLIINEKNEMQKFIGKETVTASGKSIMLYGNIGGIEDVDAVLDNGGEGIGLLRSEFLYLERDSYPSEEVQFKAYKSIAEKMGGRSVIIRTLDIGADKNVGYFDLPAEENPALGFRGIRICLSRSELFRTQLRAICRASAYGNIAVMLPMVVSANEVRESREFLKIIQDELSSEGVPFDRGMKLGIMLETPAAAIMSAELAAIVDFFSVGTNDLCQYTLAADRQNPLVADICSENLEPVFRLIGMAAQNIHRYDDKWIGICGELAADTSLTQRFLDKGVDEFSVSAPYLLKIKKKISECN